MLSASPQAHLQSPSDVHQPYLEPTPPHLKGGPNPPRSRPTTPQDLRRSLLRSPEAHLSHAPPRPGPGHAQARPRPRHTASWMSSSKPTPSPEARPSHQELPGPQADMVPKALGPRAAAASHPPSLGRHLHPEEAAPVPSDLTFIHSAPALCTCLPTAEQDTGESTLHLNGQPAGPQPAPHRLARGRSAARCPLLQEQAGILFRRKWPSFKSGLRVFKSLSG